MAAPVAPITIPPVPPPLSQNTGSLTAASMPPLDLPIPSSPPTEPETPPPAPPVPVSAPPVSIPVPPVSAPPVVSAPPAQAQSATTRQCPSCGYDNALAVKFCGNCGKRVDGAPLPPPEPEAQGRTMFMHAADPLPGVNEKQCKLVAIDQQGREGMNFSIKKGETLCGRHTGAILFVDDPFVSPTHCKFVFSGDKLVVHDAQSLNGVYLRVKQERRLQDGELIRLGRQLFRFEQLKNAAFQVKKAASDDSRIWGSPTTTSFGRIVQILDDGRTGEIRLLAGERVQIGREIGDVVIPTDGFISGRHCVFMLHNGEPVLSDLGSSNGTYVRVRDQAELAHGDFVLVGNQMLRVEIV